MSELDKQDGVFGVYEPPVTSPVESLAAPAATPVALSSEVNPVVPSSHSTISPERQLQDDKYNDAVKAINTLKAKYPELASKISASPDMNMSSASLAGIEDQANALKSEQEVKEMKQAMMSGTMALAGGAAVLGMASEGQSQSNAQAQSGDSILGARDFSSRPNGLFASLLREEKNIVALSGGENFSTGQTGQLSVPAGLPEVAQAISSKKNVDLAGQGELQRQIRGDSRALA